MNFTDTTFVWAVWIGVAGLLQVATCKLNFLWHFRRSIGAAAGALYIVSFPVLAVTQLRPWAGLGAFLITLFLLVNALRLWMNRFPEAYLRHAILLNLWWLMLGLAVAGICSELVRRGYWHLTPYYGAGFLLTVSAVTGLFMCARAFIGLRRYHADPVKPLTREHDLPTVTLAIPARNETHALEETLVQAIKSDYRKLEILVLDDCSQDATAAVIRNFAQDGVRFVQGNVPADGWLGKNYACETLAAEASGDVIIFAGVDTHFDPQSISRMVNYMVRTKTEMLSVVPSRREFDFAPTFFEPLRNFWQIILPISRRHVPISNQCWAIWSDSLRRLGSFAAYKNSVFPEVHFAQTLRAKQSYRFILSNAVLGVTTRKRLSSQLETATRTFYPALKRRPALILLATALFTTVLLLPYGVLLWQLGQDSLSTLTPFAAVAVVSLTVAHIAILRVISPRGWWMGFVNFPFLVLFEILLYDWSMLQFEFGEVNWKGRNVCYPIMETIPMEKFTAALSDQ